MSDRVAGSRRLGLAFAVTMFAGLVPGGLVLPGESALAPKTADPPSLPGGGPTWQAQGSQAGAAFGASLASAGDVNGDGIADVIVGEPDYDGPSTPNPHEGRAMVFLGSPSGPSLSPIWAAEGAQDGFGAAVASAGDVNGDGFDDIIVGEPGFVGPNNLYRGRVVIY